MHNLHLPLTVAVAVAVLSSSVSSECPDAWTKVGESCYHIAEERSTWLAARQVSKQNIFFKKKNIPSYRRQIPLNLQSTAAPWGATWQR